MTGDKNKKETDEEFMARRAQWLKDHVNLNGPMSDEWWEGDEKEDGSFNA